ncbi:MAG TPA: VCBS repeat-containing protein [Myxococcales bacterium]|nr:VCBS repeat-containing protein [Myxococcales bacterium]
MKVVSMTKAIALLAGFSALCGCQVVSEGPGDEFHCTVSTDCPAAQSCCADDFCRSSCACGNAGAPCRSSADCCTGASCQSGSCRSLANQTGGSTGASTTGAHATGSSTTGASTSGTGGGTGGSTGATSTAGPTSGGSTGGSTSAGGSGSTSSGGGSTGCAGQGASCTPADSCDLGQTDCSGNCVDTFEPNPSMNGQACSGGTACWDGFCLNCGDTCWAPTGNPCDYGTLSCATGVTCQDTGEGSPASNGASCGPGKVCNDGACQACDQGASCPSAFPCGAAAIDCSQGVPDCLEIGPNSAAEGTPCGGAGEVCLDGGCTCPPGQVLCGTACTAGSCNTSCGPNLFGPQAVYVDDMVGIAMVSVALGDFNGDGFLDVAASYGDGIGLLPGTGTGGFGSFTALVTDGGFDLGDLVTGDFNGDHVTDLAFTNGYLDAGIGVLLGSGGGGLGSWTNFPVPGSGSLAAGDLNGDGRPDLVTAFTGGVSVLLGTGTGSFESPNTFAAGTPSGIALGDVDGDGNLDAVLAECSSPLGANVLGVLLGDGHGNLGPETEYSLGPNDDACALGVALGDFNGDGWLDAAIVTLGSSDVYVLLGTGHGTFSTTAMAYPLGVARSLAFATTGDFNGDGYLDLAVAQNDFSSYGAGPPPLTDDTVSILLGTGNGSFAVQPPMIVGSSPISIAVGVLKNGGGQDLVVANNGYATASLGDTVSVLLNQCP